VLPGHGGSNSSSGVVGGDLMAAGMSGSVGGIGAEGERSWLGAGCRLLPCAGTMAHVSLGLDGLQVTCVDK
jgi:hypothetical protein